MAKLAAEPTAQDTRNDAVGDAPPRRRVRRGPVGNSLPEGGAAAAGDHPLPGELEPITWSPDRGPVTDDEALGSLRRRRRIEAAKAPKRPGSVSSDVPEELPGWDDRKAPVIFRLPPRALALAHARCEIEETNLTAVVEAFLNGYAMGIPQEPEKVEERQRSLLDRTKRWFDGTIRRK